MVRIVLGLLFMIIGLCFLLRVVPGRNAETALGMLLFVPLFWAVGVPLVAHGWRTVQMKPNR